jgi:hypothetical protein
MSGVVVGVGGAVDGVPVGAAAPVGGGGAAAAASGDGRGYQQGG